MKQHPLSAVFPAMPAEDYQSLVDSISVNGVFNPITTFEGMVLDGWHRFKAANEVGVACPTVDLGNVDPKAFVIAQNRDRRHITKGQLALAAAEVQKWRPAGRNPAATAGLETKTTKEAAHDVGVSERMMRQAKAVESKAAPEVKKAAKDGAISIERAAEIAQLPAKDQVKAIKAPKPNIEDVPYYGPSEAELEEARAAAEADLSSLYALMEADDKLAASIEENKQLRAENAVLKSTRDGYMNRCNEQIARINSLRKQLEKAKAAHV